MKKCFVLMLSAACFLLMGAFARAASYDRGDRICLYQGRNFHGYEQCYRPGQTAFDLKHVQVGSLRVYGQALVTLYEAPDFRGSMIELNGDIPDLEHIPLATSIDFREGIGSLCVVEDPAPRSMYVLGPQVHTSSEGCDRHGWCR
jgi:hypothetical protein